MLKSPYSYLNTCIEEVLVIQHTREIEFFFIFLVTNWLKVEAYHYHPRMKGNYTKSIVKIRKTIQIKKYGTYCLCIFLKIIRKWRNCNINYFKFVTMFMQKQIAKLYVVVNSCSFNSHITKAGGLVAEGQFWLCLKAYLKTNQIII